MEGKKMHDHQQQKLKGTAQKERFITSLAESERINAQIQGALMMIGSLEERGEKGIGFRLATGVTKFVAKNALLWSPEDIEATMEEGREHERSITEIEAQGIKIERR